MARSAQPLFLKPLYQKSADFVLRYMQLKVPQLALRKLKGGNTPLQKL
jgi:hypothetical protein